MVPEDRGEIHRILFEALGGEATVEGPAVGEFSGYAAQWHHASQLMAMPDEAYAAGLDRIEADLQRLVENKPIESELCLVRVQGDKAAPDRGAFG